MGLDAQEAEVVEAMGGEEADRLGGDAAAPELLAAAAVDPGPGVLLRVGMGKAVGEAFQGGS